MTFKFRLVLVSAFFAVQMGAAVAAVDSTIIGPLRYIGESPCPPIGERARFLVTVETTTKTRVRVLIIFDRGTRFPSAVAHDMDCNREGSAMRCTSRRAWAAGTRVSINTGAMVAAEGNQQLIVHNYSLNSSGTPKYWGTRVAHYTTGEVCPDTIDAQDDGLPSDDGQK